MSLWYESMATRLYDCGDIRKSRARCVLAHLSMAVPRQWWERALQAGSIDESYTKVLNGCRLELDGLPELAPFTDYALLMALAFIDESVAESSRKSAQVYGRLSFEEYVTGAERALESHPELRRLAETIAK